MNHKKFFEGKKVLVTKENFSCRAKKILTAKNFYEPQEIFSRVCALPPFLGSPLSCDKNILND